MVDLSTTYLGMKLKNPLVASSSPLTQKVESIQKMEEAGVSALVLYSLFEEQIVQESLKLHHDLLRGSESYAEALSYLPDYGQYSIGPEKYIDHIKKVKKAVNIPVIGSLNGVTTGGWIEYAQKIEQAGADALELNLYYLAADPEMTSSALEDNYIHLVQDIRRQVDIPIAVKLSPFFTALPNFARRLQQAGANGLVLFNRFYQPDLDLENLEVVPNLVLSNSYEVRLPLRWIAILYGKIGIDFALTSGVHTAEDMLKAVMAGANVTTIASTLLQNGIEASTNILSTAKKWMEDHEYESIFQMRGSMSQQAVGDPATFERANYMRVLSSY
jgi:dihydroorotate dehydrogenase (fumarate)